MSYNVVAVPLNLSVGWSGLWCGENRLGRRERSDRSQERLVVSCAGFSMEKTIAPRNSPHVFPLSFFGPKNLAVKMLYLACQLGLQRIDCSDLSSKP